MHSNDRAATMRYQVPFAPTVDSREELPYGRHRYSPPSVRDWLGLQGRSFQPVRYATPRGGVARNCANIENIANLLRGRGHSADVAAELRDRHGRGRRDLGPDPVRSLPDRPNWFEDWWARNRAARRPPLQEVLEEAFGRRHNSDHRHHCGQHHDHHHDHDHDHSCHQKSSCCGCGDSDSKAKKEYSFKTKDVTLRGKSYQIRKSFLADLSKFENELVKFVDKKSEEELPERVIQLLVDYINEDCCECKVALDLVGLNILASNLGYKSAVEYSLEELKKTEVEYLVRAEELTRICGTITMSGKVDEGLESWLKKFIRNHDALPALENSRSFQVLVANHPEVWTKLETIMGWRDKEDKLGLMVL